MPSDMSQTTPRPERWHLRRQGGAIEVDGPIEHLSPRGWLAVVPEPKPGQWDSIAAALDAYHAVNLLEALKVIPDTGDWHGSLRISCQIVVDRESGYEHQPNQTAKWMREEIRRAE